METARRSRLFVALWPDPDVVSELELAVAPLAERFPAVRWQTPDRWHITVAFLGERGERAQTARLSRIALPKPGPLALRGAGNFGTTLWVGVDAEPWLNDLAREVRQGFAVDETRRFLPHVTVGRVRGAPGDAVLGEVASQLAGIHLESWVPRRLELVRSTTGPYPRYETVVSRPLPD